MPSTFGIDLAAVKVFLGISPLDTTRDSILAALLDASLRSLRDITGRNLDYGSYRDTFHVFPQRLYLREYPVVAPLFSISTGTTLIPADDFKLFETTGLIDFKWHRPSSPYFTDTYSYAVVEYVGGYDTLPGDMYLAVMNAIHAANNAQLLTATYGGPLKRLTVYDVGVQEFASGSGVSSIIRDILAMELAQYMSLGYSMGTPNLHESEYVGLSTVFIP